VYLTGKGCDVFDKTGKQIEHITIAEPWTANVCFVARTSTRSLSPQARVFTRCGCALPVSAVN